jgi:hypothetical protein
MPDNYGEFRTANPKSPSSDDLAWINYGALMLTLAAYVLRVATIPIHAAALLMGIGGVAASSLGKASGRWAGIVAIILAIVGMAASWVWIKMWTG